MSLIMKGVRVVVVDVVAAGGGVLLAALPPGAAGTVGEELDAAPLEDELRIVGRLLLMVQRFSGVTPKLNAAGFASVIYTQLICLERGLCSLSFFWLGEEGESCCCCCCK